MYHGVCISASTNAAHPSATYLSLMATFSLYALHPAARSHIPVRSKASSFGGRETSCSKSDAFSTTPCWKSTRRSTPPVSTTRNTDMRTALAGASGRRKWKTLRSMQTTSRWQSSILKTCGERGSDICEAWKGGGIGEWVDWKSGGDAKAAAASSKSLIGLTASTRKISGCMRWITCKRSNKLDKRRTFTKTTLSLRGKEEDRTLTGTSMRGDTRRHGALLITFNRDQVMGRPTTSILADANRGNAKIGMLEVGSGPGGGLYIDCLVPLCCLSRKAVGCPSWSRAWAVDQALKALLGLKSYCHTEMGTLFTIE